MIIKKWNTTGSGSWEEIYPKTLETMIYDSDDPTVSLFYNGKIKQNYLPDSVYGGMTFVGTIGTSGGTPTTTLDLARLIDGTMTTYYTATQLDSFTGKSYTNGDYADIGQRYIGHYWVISNGAEGVITLSDSTSGDEAEWGTAVFDDGEAPVVETSGPTNKVVCETGDWLIITGWDNTNSRWKFRVISNTYRGATTSNKGIVEMATDTEVGQGTSTTLVASVKQIKDTYSLLTHTHDDSDIDMSQALNNLNTDTNDQLSDVLSAINTEIGSLDSSISTNTSNISTNATNITSNASSISTNTSNISTNTTNISTNATDITALENRKQVFVSALAPASTVTRVANDLWFDL